MQRNTAHCMSALYPLPSFQPCFDFQSLLKGQEAALINIKRKGKEMSLLWFILFLSKGGQGRKENNELVTTLVVALVVNLFDWLFFQSKHVLWTHRIFWVNCLSADLNKCFTGLIGGQSRKCSHVHWYENTSWNTGAFTNFTMTRKNGENKAIRLKHRPARKAKSFLMSKLSGVCGTICLFTIQPIM